MKDIEHRIQVACVTWFGYAYPQYKGLLFAVPNGGRRDRITGARLKAEGVQAGVADLILLLPRGKHNALCLELKTPQGRQSAAQKQWQQQATRYGARYEIIRSFDDFRRSVQQYLQL